MGLGPAVWPWLPSLFLAVSGFLAAMILGLPAWVVLHARGGLAR